MFVVLCCFQWVSKGDGGRIRVLSKLKNFLSLWSVLVVDYERELDRDQFVAFRDALFRLLLLRDIEVQKMALHAVVRLYPQIAPYYSGDVVSEMRRVLAQRAAKEGMEVHGSSIPSQVKRHRNNMLKGLMSISRLKTGLLAYNLRREDKRCCVRGEARPFVVAVVIRILYNKLSEQERKTGRHNKRGPRKAAIITYVAGLEEAEICAFLEILHHNFVRWREDRDDRGDGPMRRFVGHLVIWLVVPFGIWSFL